MQPGVQAHARLVGKMICYRRSAVAWLTGVHVAVEEHVHAVLVGQGLHGDAHLLKLLVGPAQASKSAELA